MSPVMNETIMNITLSAQNALRPANTSPMDFYAEAQTLTSSDLVQLCGRFSNIAIGAAIAGIIITFIAIVWFGKYREDIIRKFGLPMNFVQSIDKFLLMMIAFAFAMVIAKLIYGG